MNKRTILVKDGHSRKGPVIYWMNRDQRIHDNWSLLTAQEFAVREQLPLIIIICLSPEGYNSRQYSFMLNALEEIYNTAAEYNIVLHLINGKATSIADFIKETDAAVLFTDFHPLRRQRTLLSEIIKMTDIPVYQTDAHNIVPAFIVSGKQEFSALHFRKKITPLLKEYLEEYPPLSKVEKTNINLPVPDFAALTMKSVYTAGHSEILPGQNNAYTVLEEFLNNRFNNYIYKNNPAANAVSGLSPYLHSGHLSAQRVVLNAEKMNLDAEVKKSFLDELIVRKELSDNFCLYNNFYDSFEGFPQWGKETLNKHRNDEREFIYSTSQFESSETHDPLWNAAQNEMTAKGKMHGYMRMYWCKKILEWSTSPEEAVSTAVYLNDKYELDGNDPNGYTGIAWSIGGLHDRPFAERPVYGRIRYMNYEGCRRKFNVDKYIEQNRKE